MSELAARTRWLSDVLLRVMEYRSMPAMGRVMRFCSLIPSECFLTRVGALREIHKLSRF